MSLLGKMSSALSLLKGFLTRGKWLIIPLVIALVLLAILIILSSSTGLGVLIYPLI